MNYLLHTSALLAFCFLYYRFLLQRETNFQLNRWLLLGCIIASFTLPLITIPATWSLRQTVFEFAENNTSSGVTDSSEAYPELSTNREGTTIPPVVADSAAISSGKEDNKNVDSLLSIAPIATEVTLPPQQPTVEPKQPQKTFAFNLSSILPILGWIYLAGVLVFALHFLIQIGLLLVRMLRHPGYDLGRFRIVELNQEFAPYSFWNRIFLNPNCYDPETFHRIVEHEQIHVTQKHSIDILLAELLVVIQWFNPFAWFYRSAIEDNLEYLTDAEMIRQGTDPVEYQLSLVQVAIPNHPQGLTSNYNQTFLEKRITMMKAKKSSSRSGWKYLALLPILVFSVLQLNAVSDTSTATLQSADPTPPTTDYYSSTINGEVTTEDET
ncbi:MAG: M56 family metallopeptidase, partial [Bacteroidota bacterium]